MAITAALTADQRRRSALLARFFKGLGDPTRVLILTVLLDGERNVGELVRQLGAPQGRVSSHLSCLRWCGYVQARRVGRNVYYRIADERVRTLLRLAADLVAEHARELLTCQVLDTEADDAATRRPPSITTGAFTATSTPRDTVHAMKPSER
jgi:DNA-binding transcriptional ArsR family regulator